MANESDVFKDVDRIIEEIGNLSLRTPNFPIVVERIRSKQEGLEINVDELIDRRKEVQESMKAEMEENEKIAEQLKLDGGLVPKEIFLMLIDEIKILDQIIANRDRHDRISTAFSDKAAQLVEGAKSLDVMKEAMEQFNTMLNDNKEATKQWVNMMKELVSEQNRMYSDMLGRRLTAIESALSVRNNGDSDNVTATDDNDELAAAPEPLQPIEEYIRNNKKVDAEGLAEKYDISVKDAVKAIDDVQTGKV